MDGYLSMAIPKGVLVSIGPLIFMNYPSVISNWPAKQSPGEEAVISGSSHCHYSQPESTKL
jgi:hypothetical protein